MASLLDEGRDELGWGGEGRRSREEEGGDMQDGMRGSGGDV